ncbi:MAG TPA: OmpA family protein [Bacilli bacterium]
MSRKRRKKPVRKKRRAHDDEPANETWLIPYSDLLTLLLAMFIVLFASSKTDVNKFEEMMVAFNSVLSGGSGIFEKSTLVPVGNSLSTKDRSNEDVTQRRLQTSLTRQQMEQFIKETQDLEKLKAQIDKYITENGLTAELKTELNSHQLVLKISDNALFAPASATVKDEAKKLALTIASMLEQYPQYEVVVSGHTDNVPIHTAEFPSNWELSAKRALNFMKILLSDKKLSPERFSAIGYGEYRPVASNDTAEGRAKNRRVEVAIVRAVQADIDLEEFNRSQSGNTP